MFLSNQEARYILNNSSAHPTAFQPIRIDFNALLWPIFYFTGNHATKLKRENRERTSVNTNFQSRTMADIWSDKNIGFIGPNKFLSDLTVGPTHFAKSACYTINELQILANNKHKVMNDWTRERSSPNEYYVKHHNTISSTSKIMVKVIYCEKSIKCHGHGVNKMRLRNKNTFVLLESKPACNIIMVTRSMTMIMTNGWINNFRQTKWNINIDIGIYLPSTHLNLIFLCQEKA